MPCARLDDRAEVRYPEQKKTADDQIAQRALAIISWDAMVPNDAEAAVPRATFVLTHHPRAPIAMEGGTTFHFVTNGIDAALERARAAAADKDV